MTVIVLAGLSGAGKSTVSRSLAKKLDCPLIEGDAFDHQIWPDDLEQWVAEGHALSTLPDGGMVAAIANAPQDARYVVVDSTLAPFHISGTVDTLCVFLDVPFELALARRLKRYFEFHRAAPADWPIDRLARGVELDLIAYLEQCDRVLMQKIDCELRPLCNTIIDATGDVIDITMQILKILQKQES